MRIFKNDIICFRAPFITIKRVPLGTRGTGSTTSKSDNDEYIKGMQKPTLKSF